MLDFILKWHSTESQYESEISVEWAIIQCLLISQRIKTIWTFVRMWCVWHSRKLGSVWRCNWRLMYELCSDAYCAHVVELVVNNTASLGLRSHISQKVSRGLTGFMLYADTHLIKPPWSKSPWTDSIKVAFLPLTVLCCLYTSIIDFVIACYCLCWSRQSQNFLPM